MLSGELAQQWTSNLREPLRQVEYVPNLQLVLALDKLGRLNLLDSASGKLIKRFEFDFGLQLLGGPIERLNEFALSHDGELLALSGTIWNSIAVLNMSRLRSLDEFPAVRVTKWNEIWSTNLVVSGGGGRPSVAFVGSLAFLAEFRKESFTEVGFCDRDTRVVATTNRGRLIGWDTASLLTVEAKEVSATNAEIYSLYVREVIPSRFIQKELRGLACNNKGQLALVGDEGRDGFLQLWNSREGELIASVRTSSLAAHSTRANRVTFDKSGDFFLTVGDVEDQIWQIDNDMIKPIARVITRKYPRLFQGSHIAAPWPAGGFILYDGEGTFVIDPVTVTATPIGVASKEPRVCRFNIEHGFEC